MSLTTLPVHLLNIFLFPVICFELPITRTFFDFPRRFELSEVDVSAYMKHEAYLWYIYIYIVLHTYIRLFKAFKNKDKYFQRMPWKGSLRGCPYGKNPRKKNLKSILILKVYIQNISVNILIGFSGAEKRRFPFSISVPVEFYPWLEISVLSL